jgi:hypothetical protein
MFVTKEFTVLMENRRGGHVVGNSSDLHSWM